MQIHLVGGFLGSGKTTAIAAACKSLAVRKLTAGVITNDQGKYLVDTAFFDWQKIPAVQVPGGCFCCNYDDLISRFDQLERAVQPDVVFAEADGSCADLVATVLKPLNELGKSTGGNVTLSIFTDTRLLSLYLEGEELPFSHKVMYVYGRQLEEAGLLILNKRDLVSPGKARQSLEEAYSRFPAKQIRLQNSLDSLQIDAWLDDLDAMSKRSTALDSLQIDYNRYSEGEAALGWLDTHILFNMPSTVDLRAVIVDWIANLTGELRQRTIGVGHLKIMLKAGRTEARVSLTAGDTAGWRAQIPEMRGKELKALVNARMEAEPAVIRELVVRTAQAAAAKTQGQVEEKDTETLTPVYPKPKRRIP